MPGQLQNVDFIVLVAYMAGVFGLGCWFARKSGTTTEFMAAGRSLPGWAVGLSVFGTYVSSIGFLGNTGKAFGGTWNSWVFGLSLPLAAFVAVRYFIPIYRSGDEVSAYYHLEKRFGPWARTFAMICFLLMQLARCGAILYLVALALAPLTGWQVSTIILITGVLVTIYTLLGGIEAVIWTDVVQSFVLVAGAILCAVLLVTGTEGGLGKILEVASANNKFDLGSFSLAPQTLKLPDPTFWMVLLFGFFINLKNFGIDQGFVQRYITAKTDRDATQSIWLAAILFPIASALFFLIGTMLFCYCESDATFVDEIRLSVATKQLESEGIVVTDAALRERMDMLKPSEYGDKVLPQFILKKLPVGLSGLLIAAIFAAAMSSMDTSLNSSATLVLCDVYRRYLKPNAGERESMLVLYGSTLVFGAAGTMAALAMIRDRSALDMWWILEGIFSGGMLGLFLLGLISRKAQNSQAVLAVVLGVLLIMWLSLSTTAIWPTAWSGMANPFHKFMTIVFGTSAIVLVGVLASALATKPSNEVEL